MRTLTNTRMTITCTSILEWMGLFQGNIPIRISMRLCHMHMHIRLICITAMSIRNLPAIPVTN